MKLIIYVAVNKYYKTSLLAICFVSTESFELYNFSHQSYLDVGFQKPRKAFTDRAGAHLKFFNEVWNDVEHCLCPVHIYHNIQKYLAEALGIYGHDFKKEFSPILKEVDKQKFEVLFSNFKKKYVAKFEMNTPEHKRIENWIENLYQIKQKWAFCYIGQTFSAGMQSTQRNESMNHKVKSYITSCKRTTFVKMIEIFKEINEEEDAYIKLQEFKLKSRTSSYLM